MNLNYNDSLRNGFTKMRTMYIIFFKVDIHTTLPLEYTNNYTVSKCLNCYVHLRKSSERVCADNYFHIT